MFRRVATLVTLCTLLVACAPVHARPLVQLDIVDRDRGDWLERYRHRGHDWIAGNPGHRYAVRLTNTTSQRVLVVLSVDGVNAVTGQTADPSQAGYVLGPWQTTEVNGWRKSLDDVAQFVFTDLPDSYAARTGRPFDVGVIGIAVFEEDRRYYDERVPMYRSGEARDERENGAARAAAPAAAEADAMRRDAQRQGLGTGHGAREWSPASRTEFVRATHSPAQVTQLRYDDYPTLLARGVVPRRWRNPWHEDGPRAFPGAFVEDPPRW